MKRQFVEPLAGRTGGPRTPLGRRVTYAYDNNGRLATVMDPEGGVTRYTYLAQGRMLTLTDARGSTYLTIEYDTTGRVSTQELQVCNTVGVASQYGLRRNGATLVRSPGASGTRGIPN